MVLDAFWELGYKYFYSRVYTKMGSGDSGAKEEVEMESHGSTNHSQIQIITTSESDSSLDNYYITITTEEWGFLCCSCTAV